MNYDDDFIEGIFDHLTPEEFHVETTAIGIVDLATQDSAFQGAAAFERFVNRQLETVRSSYAIAEGEVMPIGVLANLDTQYVFIPNEDEDMTGWTNRMRREAQSLRATWTFIAYKCEVGTTVGGESEDVEVDDLDVFARAAARSKVKVGILFYAQRREGEDIERCQGYMHDEDSLLGPIHIGRTTQQLPMFNLLGG